MSHFIHHIQVVPCLPSAQVQPSLANSHPIPFCLLPWPLSSRFTPRSNSHVSCYFPNKVGSFQLELSPFPPAAFVFVALTLPFLCFLPLPQRVPSLSILLFLPHFFTPCLPPTFSLEENKNRSFNSPIFHVIICRIMIPLALIGLPKINTQ